MNIFTSLFSNPIFATAAQNAQDTGLTADSGASHNHTIVLAVALVVGIGSIAQWLAWRFKIPAIVLLSVGGLIIGPILGSFSDYLPWLQHLPNFSLEDTHELHAVISLAVAIILFEGGLNLRIRELREAGSVVKRLTSVGVILAWAFGTLACHYIGNISWDVSILMGALLVVTGPTVIMPMLRQAGLNKKTASYLKWEGIINDPIGVLLAVLVFEYLLYSAAADTFTSILRAFSVALILGAGGGYLLGRIFRAGFVPEYLKAPSIFSLVIVFFALSNAVQEEAGLLTVTVMGMVMGNMKLQSIEEMRRFKEYLTILLVSAVFVILTAALQPESLEIFDERMFALVLAFMFIVRPAAIWLSTIGLKMKWQERFLVGWIAPRGVVAAAAAGVFATPLLASGNYPDAVELVPFTFALIFATVLAHGFSVAWLGRKLGLSVSTKKGVLLVGGSPWSIGLAKTLKEMDVNIIVSDTSWHRLREARLANVPVYYGEILSDRAEESLEFVSVGTLFAATSNDAYNALICTSFGPEMNRRHIYQLAMNGEDEHENNGTASRGVSHARRGVTALGESHTFENLWAFHARGWSFQKTRLTEEYTWQSCKKDLHDQAVWIARVMENGEVEFASPEYPFEPTAGDRVISYVPEAAARQPRQNALEKVPAPEIVSEKLPE